MRQRTKLILRIKALTIAFVFIFISSEAKYTQNCSAKYLTNDGWSKFYSVDVTFVTGYELNQSTETSNYSFFTVYAVIFWSQDQVTIISLTNVYGCATTTNKACIAYPIMDYEGKDQSERKWKICLKEFCY